MLLNSNGDSLKISPDVSGKGFTNNISKSATN
jgi:hypothetical protein